MPDKKGETGVARAVNDFVRIIDGLSKTLTISMGSLLEEDEEAHKKIDNYIEKYGLVREEDGKKYFRIKSHEYCHDYNMLRERLDRVHAALPVLPRSLQVALVSQYDAFLGNLLRSLINLRPELLKASGTTLTFAELTQFGSLDDARDFVLEKEIETMLRKSHADQFTFLENKFDIELRKDLPEWPAFVELTERRNLFVHADGVVSNQYLANCREHGVQLEKDARAGKQLDISPEYFRTSYHTLYQIAVKLSQVLWRKVAPQEAENADSNLADITFSLLRERRYAVATVLLDFADTTLKKRHATERYRLMFLINRALAYRLQNEKGKCSEILATQDWTATSDAYQLAELVLSEKWDSAANVMKKIGSSAYPHKADYLHWPLFTEFRKTEQFSSAFKAIFGDDTHDEQMPTAEPPKKATVQ